MGSTPASRLCGSEILDWILHNNLHILNGGSATRTSCITGNNSTPDISFCGSNWPAKTSWKLGEPIGSSDYLPIVIEINHKICYQPVISRSGRWRRNWLVLLHQSSWIQNGESPRGTKFIFSYHLLQQYSEICSDHSPWEIKTEQEIQTLDDFTRAR